MFTGLVEDTAEVLEIENAGEGKRTVLKSDSLEGLEEGSSVSVSGACLTVEKEKDGRAEFFLAEETVEKTWFSDLTKGEMLNIEHPLSPTDRMGGHYVQGHVEEILEIVEVEELDEGWNLWFSMPESPYIVEKGFVAIEGISLTVAGVEEDRFSVTIIPETWSRTNLSGKKEGDRVNFEADVMAKYAESVTH
jgi:riboflavin synthase